MRNKILVLLTTVLLLLLLLPAATFADEGTYAVQVIDDADLLTDAEEAQLYAQLLPLSSYANMGVLTSEEFNSDTASFARSEYLRIFGETDGTLFVIDMFNRRIQIFSGGAMYRTISTAKANEITDNIYTYASDGDYYRTVSKAFEQIAIVLEGGHIVTPMKYATNAAFAIGLALIINFIIITVQRKKSKAANSLTNALAGASSKNKSSAVKSVHAVMTHQSKTKHVESSGSGARGGFGGGGGFSGGGGGGFSGGGGGHSF